MGDTYTNTKRKGGKPTPLQKLTKRLLYLGAIGLACAAVYTIVKSIRSADTTTAEVQLPYGSIQELSDPETFMAAYLSVNCKAALLQRTQTIRVAGTIESGGASEAFTLIKKRPDKMRFTINRGSHEMTFGVSGDTVWRRIRAPQQEDHLALIEGDEAGAWRTQARFFDRIIEAHLDQGAVSAIDAADWKGRDCLKVRVVDADEKTAAIFIDPQTLYPLAERQTLPDGTMQETVFSDYRDVDGLPTPFQMTTSVGSEFVSRIQIQSAALNTGLLSKLFELPETLHED